VKNITIGKVDGKKTAVKIDLRVLKQTRLLITADSGGGKTYLMKKIVEEAKPQIPIHIIDPEGEFSPLRELFDFFLIAKGGDTPPVVGLAKAQAQKFLELRASVICDIYELKPSQRHEWVKEYLEGLIEAPKAMRHPCLVIVDEAHLFAPETGKSVAADAMADLASRGRKRGLILIVATQRLAKLNKDVTSEMLNRLIGPTFEDVNRKRAAEVLGVLKENTQAFFEQIRLLEPGHFFALGRAISKKLICVKIGAIRTKHGDEAEKYNTAPPPPRSKIAALLKTLKELPAEEERRAETAKEFRAEIRRLRDELQIAKFDAKRVTSAHSSIDRKGVQKEIETAVKARERKIRGEYLTAIDAVLATARAMTKEGGRIADEMRSLSDRTHRAIGKTAKKLEIVKFKAPTENAIPVETRAIVVPAKNKPISRIATTPGRIEVAPSGQNAVYVEAKANGDEGPINKSQVKILQVLVDLAQIGDSSPSKSKVAFWSGASVTSSTFSNNVSNLKTRGKIVYPTSGTIAIVPSVADEFRPRALTAEDVRARSRELLTGSQIAMMDAIQAQYPEELSKEDLCTAVGAASIKSSTFNNNVSELKTAGLISYPRSGFVRMAEWLNV
jgi:hypothetical protein